MFIKSTSHYNILYPLNQPILATVGTMPTASFIGHTNAAAQKDNENHYLKKTQMADNVYNKKTIIFIGRLIILNGI